MHKKINIGPIDVNTLPIGAVVKDFYICIEKSIKKTKNGDLYVDIILKNKFGLINGKIWSNTEYFKDRFSNGDPVAVKGECSDYKGGRLITILSINSITNNYYNKYGYNVDDLLGSSTMPKNNSFKDIQSIIKSLPDNYSNLIFKIYKNNKTKLSKLPLTLYRHYSFIGGYISYINNLLKVAKIYENYTCINKDILYVAILLHDIGKVRYFDDKPLPSITEDGRLLGVTELSINIINEYGKLASCPSRLIKEICHIVLSLDKLKQGIKNDEMQASMIEVEIVLKIKELDLAVCD